MADANPWEDVPRVRPSGRADAVRDAADGTSAAVATPPRRRES